MRGIKILVLVLVGLAGLALGTGAATGQKNPAAKRTPAVHVRDLVVNGRSIDRMRAPAQVTRLLKRTAVSPAFSCLGATTKVNNASAQTCVWPASFAGSVTCIQTSTSPTVTQTCDASQTNTSQANRARITQIVWSQGRSLSTQNATQIVRLRQINASGANFAGINQYIKQSLGPGTPDDTDDDDAEPLASLTASAIQNQNSHQTIHLRQVTTTGDSNASVLQFLRQRERASNVGTVNQSQNTGPSNPESECTPDPSSDGLVGVFTDPNANQCVLSNQTSSVTAGGLLNLDVNQDYNQFQRVRKAAGGFQNQGLDGIGGSDIGLTQLSSALSNILTNQNERLVQRALDAAAVFQDQNGPRKSRGSTQGTNPADVWTGFQTSTLIQTSHATGLSPATTPTTTGHQSDLLEYFGDTSGDVRASQTATINGAVTNWGCPPPGLPTEGQNKSCRALVNCQVGEGGGDLQFQAVAGVCTPTCPEGTVFNRDTGTCQPVVCTDESCTTSTTTTTDSTTTTIGSPTTPSYSYRR